MSVDIYTPRQMNEALRVMMPSRAFLKRFFPVEKTFLTEKVDLDKQIGARILAPFVNPMGTGGKPMDRRGFTTDTATPPLIAPKRAMTVPDMQQRLPGETIYSGRDPMDRAREILGSDLRDLDDAITRTEEWMRARVMFDSAVHVKGEDVDYTISFPRDGSLSLGTLGGTDAWSHASCSIYNQLLDWGLIVSAFGVTATDMICSQEAIKALLVSPKIIGSATAGGVLSVLRADLGSIKPEDQKDGAIYWGMFAGTGIRIWTYNERFIDPADGTLKPIVPAKQIILCSDQARAEMYYGAVAVSDVASGQIGVVEGKRVPWSKVTDEPPTRWIKLSSRPLPVPVHNVFLTAQVIA